MDELFISPKMMGEMKIYSIFQGHVSWGFKDDPRIYIALKPLFFHVKDRIKALKSFKES